MSLSFQIPLRFQFHTENSTEKIESIVTIAFSIQPDQRLEKHIQDWRFNYDRQLVKTNFPYICVVGPQKMRINPNRVIRHIEHLFSSAKSVKIELGKPEYLEVGDYFDVYVQVKNPKALLKYRKTLYETAFFGPLNDEDMHANILIAHQVEEDEAMDMVDSLNDLIFSHSFFARELCFYLKQQDNPWEVVQRIEL